MGAPRRRSGEAGCYPPLRPKKRRGKDGHAGRSPVSPDPLARKLAADARIEPFDLNGNGRDEIIGNRRV